MKMLPLSQAIYLRPLTVSDADIIAALHGDAVTGPTAATLRPENNAHPGVTKHSDVEDLIRAKMSGTAEPLVLQSGDNVIGQITLYNITRGPFQSADLGYWIKANFRRQGIMTAGVREVVRLAKEDLHLLRLHAITAAANAALVRVLSSNGFQRAAIRPTHLPITGEPEEHHLFQKILPEWLQSKRAWRRNNGLIS